MRLLPRGAPSCVTTASAPLLVVTKLDSLLFFCNGYGSFLCDASKIQGRSLRYLYVLEYAPDHLPLPRPPP